MEDVFFRGFVIPGTMIIYHASLRSKREGLQKYDLGFTYQTPMGYILESLGMSLAWMGLGVHSIEGWDLSFIRENMFHVFG